MDSKDLGNIGEHIAVVELLKCGCIVSRPLGDSAEYDLIIDFKGIIKTCQVKSTNTVYKNRLIFRLATASKRGGDRDTFYSVDCFILVDLKTNTVCIIDNPGRVKTFTLQYSMPKFGAKSKVKLTTEFTVSKYLNKIIEFSGMGKEL